MVEPDLLMAPVGLAGDIHLGPPNGVTKKRLDDISDRAADAIAWQICTVAGERHDRPLTTLAKSPQHVRTAVGIAKERIFTRLLSEANSWTQESQGDIHQWEAALQHTRMIMERREEFESRAHKRINAVLAAASAPAAPSSPQPQPSAARPAPADKPLPKKEGYGGLIATVVALIVLIAGIFLVGTSQTGPSSASSGSSSAVNHSVDPDVVNSLGGQSDLHRAGDFYAKWAPNGSYTCSAGTVCTELYVATPLSDGCKSVDVVVDMLKGGTVLASYHGGTSNLPKGLLRKLYIQGA